MYASQPHQGDRAGDDDRRYNSADQQAIAGTTSRPRGQPAAVDLARTLQSMPYNDMVSFCLSVSRDLLQREDPAAVSRVAEALLATAQVWHAAE